MNRRLASIITVVVGFSILELLSLLKINVLLGAKTAVFSGFSLGGPLVSLYTGMGFGAGLFLLRRMVHCVFMGTSLLSPFSLYLPTFAAALYFRSTSFWIRVATPLLCMVLFIAHPVGGQAWFYACYWLIPVVLYYTQQTQFTTALGATFVQHAVGSVLWLYIMPTTAAIWSGLLPFVAVERLVCALGMVIIMHGVAFIQAVDVRVLYGAKQQVSKI
ncbi:MAG: hypothetical protein AB7F19_01710 [Candidatus Babeliales bacterium]